MGRLLLVRHGQASYGAADYDVLSELGGEQSRALGRSFAERGIRPGLVLCGELRRHEQTVAGILEGLGASIPVQKDPGWDEFDFHGVVEVHEPRYRDLLADERVFQELFEAATGRWTSGTYDAEYTESFAAFHARVAGVLDRVVAQLHDNEHRDVVVVSSGGPIAMAVAQLTCGAKADPVTLATVWSSLSKVIVNTGVTKIIAGSSGLWMSTYNEHTHLEGDKRMFTYR
ncbi:broad specificity phosphatase PhoE [Actinoplanes lutulentus]|uniref:Broad specificity phosphatase PhoE n=1 Tax=Actinoplanes lutulentus TaxID=1287878 RepID=A0A327Z3C3_9ACTN|nr:histidine phosphatase family protein [Actinoplanes lutulentus]MBB2947860.1 broad specificity phosphatase PhoE [Actinoplanes lutulentus]RAK29827.1 broad specificity phosphatase PhoE [Actinoplanes lutulentus]